MTTVTAQNQNFTLPRDVGYKVDTSEYFSEVKRNFEK